MQKINLFHRLGRSLARISLWGLGVSAIALLAPQSTLAAEQIKFNYGLLEFSLSVDALELYAEEGEINNELNFYTKRLDDRAVKQLRRILRRRIDIDPILLYRLTRSPQENLSNVL